MNRGKRLATTWTVGGSSPGGGKAILSSAEPSRPALGPTEPSIQWALGFSWAGPGREVDHIPDPLLRRRMTGDTPVLLLYNFIRGQGKLHPFLFFKLIVQMYFQ